MDGMFDSLLAEMDAKIDQLQRARAVLLEKPTVHRKDREAATKKIAKHALQVASPTKTATQAKTDKSPLEEKPKRTISPEHREKLRAAQTKRWLESRAKKRIKAGK